jgi:DNA (cytosine-5)-methyltransferase 1
MSGTFTSNILLDSNELIVDNFAGGGGASLGIEQALGRHIDIAINHDAEALAMHTANHPHTRHFIESVWDVDPEKVCAGRPVGLAWFSPDCKHHSKARGSKPVDKKIRGLAWVVVRWARAVKPRVIALENVEEFKEWGSVIHAVDDDGKLRHHKDGKPVMVPNPKRTGATFRRWKRELEKLGYKVEHRELRAHEYGAPTIRKRLFIIARCDGLPIRWPEQTHGPGKLPYRTAAECIDFSAPARSIFERKRPLAEGTLRRIAKGLKRYVLETKEPFIVRTGHWSNITGEGFGFRGQGVNKPLATVCATNDKALVVPYIATCNHQGDGFRGFGVDEPAKTLCAARDAHGLVMPYIVGAGDPARAGEPRSVDVPTTAPLAKSDHRLTVPFLAGVGGRAGQSRPRGLNEPTATVTAKADQGMAVPVMVRMDTSEKTPSPAPKDGPAVAMPHLLKFRHYSHGASLNAPLHTISAEGQHHGMVVPYLVGAGGPSYGGKPRGVDGPMHTLLAENHQCVVAPHLVGIDHRSSGDSAAWDAKKPLTTITAENRHAVVASFIVKQNGGHESPGWPLDKPLSTITTKDHHWPAMVKLTPEQSGTYDRADHAEDVSRFLREFLGEEHADGIVHLPDGDYRIVDLGMRMLAARELFNAQGFTHDYVINPTFNGKPLTATAQVRMCGNSVSPVMSRAIISANFRDYVEDVENAA